MRADGAVGEIEPFTDLAVREALGRQLRDLEFLGTQLGPRLGYATARTLAGGTQLATRPLGKAPHPEGVEDPSGLAEWCTRIRTPSVPAQPPPVRELHTGSVERPTRSARRHRDLEPLLGSRAVGKKRSRVGQLNLEMRRTRVRRDLLPLAQKSANQVEVAVAAHGRIDEVGERPAAYVGLVGSVRGIEDARKIVIRLAWALSCESRSAARKRDQRELRVGAHRQKRRLGLGDQIDRPFPPRPARRQRWHGQASRRTRNGAGAFPRQALPPPPHQ